MQQFISSDFAQKKIQKKADLNLCFPVIIIMIILNTVKYFQPAANNMTQSKALIDDILSQMLIVTLLISKNYRSSNGLKT